MQPVPEFLSRPGIAKLLSNLIYEGDQAILVLDLTGHIVFTTPKACSLLGLTGEKNSAEDVSGIQATPPLMELIEQNFERLRTGEKWSGEFFIKLPNRALTGLQFTASYLKTEPGGLVVINLISDELIEVEKLQSINQLLQKIDDTFNRNGADLEQPGYLAELFIPEYADWCGIHLLRADGSIDKAAIKPDEILHRKAAFEWWQDDLLNDELDGIPSVITSGEARLIAEVNPIRRSATAGILSYLILPIKTQSGTMGTITLVMAESGRHFTEQAQALAQNLSINIAAHLDKFRFHQESRKLNAELEQRVNERTAELSEAITQLKQSEEMIQTLFRVSNKLNATLDVDLILDELAQEAIRIVNGESGFAGLRTAEGMTVKRYFNQGVMVPFEHTWQLGEGIPGWVMKFKVPYGTSDAANDPMIHHELSINSDIHSVICTPILDTVGEVIAYFDIRNKQGAEGFSINDQEMLLTLAPVASIAIQNALAYQQRMAKVSELNETSLQLQELAAGLESAREEERIHIARELHDQLGQALTALKFDLSWLSNQLEPLDEGLNQKARDIIAQMNTMIKTVRRIATELRPGMLDDLGLAASIEWQARDFEKRTGIDCSLSLPEDDLMLTQDQSLALFRIFQEAMTNIERHARARHIQVSLKEAGELLTLEIRDDGQGIQLNKATEPHSLGLLGMRERAKHLNGVFDVSGAPEQGTTVRVTIPIQRKS